MAKIGSGWRPSGRESRPICQHRTIWQKFRGANDHAWTTEGVGMYGNQTRRCLWCGLEQYKHRNFQRWVDVSER